MSTIIFRCKSQVLDSVNSLNKLRQILLQQPASWQIQNSFCVFLHQSSNLSRGFGRKLRVCQQNWNDRFADCHGCIEIFVTITRVWILFRETTQNNSAFSDVPDDLILKVVEFGGFEGFGGVAAWGPFRGRRLASLRSGCWAEICPAWDPVVLQKFRQFVSLHLKKGSCKLWL